MILQSRRYRLSWLALLLISASAHAQTDSSKNVLRVVARTSPDSIVLRWAPESVPSWLQGNRFGYQVERYTILRKGQLVPPEKKIITPAPLYPLPLQDWEPIAAKNKYAAIAAQALYGASFEIKGTSSSVIEIANKVEENKQRYSISLFSADVVPAVARALALYFVDRNVQKDEKYLYRVRSIPQHPGYDTLTGYTYVSAVKTELPKPMDITAEFKTHLVSIKWDIAFHRGVYTCYQVERSENGTDFRSISDDPLVVLNSEKRPASHQYAYDSIPEGGKEYFYRVRGLTPFGELGPPSEIVKGKSKKEMHVLPRIHAGQRIDNRAIELKWEFPPLLEDELKGFDIRRSSSPNGKFLSIVERPIDKSTRKFVDSKPNHINYYQVVACTDEGENFPSPFFLAMLVDSIPPSPPRKLLGKIDEKGRITLSWEPPNDPDIYGYRVYRGNILKEEFSQVTAAPIQLAMFTDSVNLRTLTSQVHYQVMAIDQNQNRSALSDILSLNLPDLVKPQPPVFLPPVATHEGPQLQWIRSSSEDVMSYTVYRSEKGSVNWKRVLVVPATVDTVHKVIDATALEGVEYQYTVLAVDEVGLESDPAAAVKSSKLIVAIKPPVVVNADVDRTAKHIRLSWTYNQPGVSRFQIYRAREGEPLRLWTTIAQSSFTDKQLTINTVYTYRVVALFISGAHSDMRQETTIRY